MNRRGTSEADAERAIVQALGFAEVFDLADAIRAARSAKPVWAFVTANASSAGYEPVSQAARLGLTCDVAEAVQKGLAHHALRAGANLAATLTALAVVLNASVVAGDLRRYPNRSDHHA